MAVEVYFVPTRDDADVEQKLSVSKVKTFDSCKAKFKYSYIEKLPKKEWDFHVFGTFMHDTLEHFHLKMIDNAKDATIPEGENPNAIQEDMWPKLMKEAFMDSCEKYKEKLSTEQKNESFVILQDYVLYRHKRKGST